MVNNEFWFCVRSTTHKVLAKNYVPYAYIDVGECVGIEKHIIKKRTHQTLPGGNKMRCHKGIKIGISLILFRPKNWKKKMHSAFFALIRLLLFLLAFHLRKFTSEICHLFFAHFLHLSVQMDNIQCGGWSTQFFIQFLLKLNVVLFQIKNWEKHITCNTTGSDYTYAIFLIFWKEMQVLALYSDRICYFIWFLKRAICIVHLYIKGNEHRSWIF